MKRQKRYLRPMNEYEIQDVTFSYMPYIVYTRITARNVREAIADFHNCKVTELENLGKKHKQHHIYKYKGLSYIAIKLT